MLSVHVTFLRGRWQFIHSVHVSFCVGFGRSYVVCTKVFMRGLWQWMHIVHVTSLRGRWQFIHSVHVFLRGFW